MREVLQNANDAGPVDGSAPVRVEFEFEHLDGEECKQFKRTFGWDETLERRLSAAAEQEQDLSIEQFLQRGTDELVLLHIRDYNTEGLSGAEDAEESNYTALVRDIHRSNKSETEGGSHGVGATVLWAFSGISAVLFNTVPVDIEDKSPPRVVGRSYLPDHTLDGRLYKGYGWFGEKDPDDPSGRNVSVWGSEAKDIASRLGMDREDEYGTTTTIVGFRQPGEPQPTEETLESVAEELREAASLYFWPAIHAGALEVTVQSPRDSEPCRVDSSFVEPFVKAYEAIGGPTGELGHPGQTSSKTISFDLPGRSDGTSTPSEGEISVGVRTAGPADEFMRNQVALFRGSGMVVRYVGMDDVANRGSDFHAVLACGTARPVGDATVNRHVEEFLRAAEPAAHDEWTGTPRLKNKYTGRRVGVVSDIQSRWLRDALSGLLVDDEDPEGTRLTDFEEMFPLRQTGSSGSLATTSTPTMSSSLRRFINDLEFDGSRWVCDLTLSPNEDRVNGRWGAGVWMTKLFEEGGEGEQVPLEGVSVVETEFDSVSAEVDDEGRVRVWSEEVGDVRVRIESIETGPPDPLSGRAARTGVRHEVLERGDDE
ncbi:hypothetical protein [Halogranum rubrum]|uniref:hypothetical protein n=1 Tax=Halogranum rubrum TaxID=553466 RepID=UPI0012FAE6FF|nr:hypothetical protein [Halogranum salarium]